MEIELHLDNQKPCAKSIDLPRTFPVTLVFPVYRLLPICKITDILITVINHYKQKIDILLLHKLLMDFFNNLTSEYESMEISL